jgi:hypothetical protein
VTTLQAEGKVTLLFHKDASKRLRILFLEGLDDIFRLRMFNKAVDLTEATSDTDFFFNEDAFHSPSPSPSPLPTGRQASRGRGK